MKRVAIVPLLAILVGCTVFLDKRDLLCRRERETQGIEKKVVEDDPDAHVATRDPWQRLADMPGSLGRFALATDGKRIYRLGGVSHNIRSGGSYRRDFSVFDPVTQVWQQLPPVPFGTGGTFLEYWPERRCFVAISGVTRLGDSFETDRVTVGIYSPTERKWSTDEIACPGLGRIAVLTHSKEGRFLVLARTNVAVLDLDEKTCRILGNYPVSGRTLGAARIGGTLFVLQGESRPPCRLHRFSPADGAHLGSVDLPDEFIWTDKLFAWRGELLVWKNSAPQHLSKYTHTSKLFSMDPTTGRCTELHPEYPGPRARRSSNGIVCGDSFYAFGGQRHDSEWLSDAYKYHLARD